MTKVAAGKIDIFPPQNNNTEDDDDDNNKVKWEDLLDDKYRYSDRSFCGGGEPNTLA